MGEALILAVCAPNGCAVCGRTGQRVPTVIAGTPPPASGTWAAPAGSAPWARSRRSARGPGSRSCPRGPAPGRTSGPAGRRPWRRAPTTGEEVEGPLRLGAGVPHLPQGGEEEVPVFPVHGDVRRLPGAVGHHQLEEAGGTHIAQGPACPAHGGVDQVKVLCRPGHQHIADPLPGQGEGLAVGITHQGIGIIGGDPGQGLRLVDGLPVGLDRRSARWGGRIPGTWR